MAKVTDRAERETNIAAILDNQADQSQAILEATQVLAAQYEHSEIKVGKNWIRVFQGDIVQLFINAETGAIHEPKDKTHPAPKKILGNILETPVAAISAEPISAEPVSEPIASQEAIEIEAVEVAEEQVEPEQVEPEQVVPQDEPKVTVTAAEAWFLLDNDELRTMSVPTLRELAERLAISTMDGNRARTRAELMSGCKAALVEIASTGKRLESIVQVESEQAAPQEPAKPAKKVKAKTEKKSTKEKTPKAPKEPKQPKEAKPKKAATIELDPALLSAFNADGAARNGKEFLEVAGRILDEKDRQNGTLQALAAAVGKSIPFVTRIVRAVKHYRSNTEFQAVIESGVSYWSVHSWMDSQPALEKGLAQFKVKQEQVAQ